MIGCKGLRALKFGLAFFTVWAPAASADGYFRIERNDPSVPVHCRDWKIESFGHVERSVFYSVEGGVEAGFTDEIEIERREAALLWAHAKPSPASDGLPESLKGYFAILQNAKGAMGFDYSKEGDVLEAFTLVDLQEHFPTGQYFTTGGISYRQPQAGPKSGGGSTMGELDVIVGRKSDCAILVIGEAKLGVRQINHARDQIKRFVNFAKGKLCVGSDENRRPICKL